MFGCWNVAMVTFCAGYGVVHCGISGNPGHPGLELGYLRSLHCVEATLDMDQKVLKKLVESISNTVKRCKY